MKQRRYTNLDLLRILACFMVVFVHSFPTGYQGATPTSLTWTVLNIYEGLIRSAIPIFFMISGVLFLGREEFSAKKLFTRNILKLVLLYFLWCVLYAIDTLGVKTVFTDFDFVAFVKAVVNFKYHLWYLPAMLSVYFLIPVLRLVRNNDKVLKYIVIMFLIFAIGRGTIGAIPQLHSVCKVADRFTFAFAGWSGYFVLGYYLYRKQKKFSVKTPVLVIMLIGVLILTMVLRQSVSILNGKTVGAIYDNNFFVSNALSAGLFLLLFLRLPSEKIPPKTSRFISKISKYTLLVYLLHPFVIEHLAPCLSDVSLVFSAPISTLAAIAVSLAVAFVLDRIPFINEWLM